MKITITSKTGTRWAVHGVNMISSDSIYQIVQGAINDEKLLTQDYLQKHTGHRAPIIIDPENHTIDFQRW